MAGLLRNCHCEIRRRTEVTEGVFELTLGFLRPLKQDFPASFMVLLVHVRLLSFLSFYRCFLLAARLFGAVF